MLMGVQRHAHHHLRRRHLHKDMERMGATAGEIPSTLRSSYVNNKCKLPRSCWRSRHKRERGRPEMRTCGCLGRVICSSKLQFSCLPSWTVLNVYILVHQSESHWIVVMVRTRMKGVGRRNTLRQAVHVACVIL